MTDKPRPVYKLIHSEEYQRSKVQEADLALEEGKVYFENNDIEMAIKCCEFAIRVNPESSPGAHVNLGFCYHLLGDHEKGWEEYEHRLYYYPELIDYMRKFGLERKWGGMTDLQDKVVVVYFEQGLGDAIHMMRYLSDLKKLGCTIDVYCSRSLMRLMYDTKIVRFVYSIEELPESINNPYWNYHIPSMSLPHLLKLYKPLSEPYISAKPMDLGMFDLPDNCFKVGIAWKGNKGHQNNHQRSCDIQSFEKLFDNPKVKFFNLTISKTTHPNIIDLAHRINDFKDTAKIISALDLVVSVDTAVLHLAGSMGKPAWALLPYHPDFRWGLYSNKTQWYPSLRLYRQTTPGNWDNVFAKVKDELKNESC